MDARIKEALQKREEKGLLRELRPQLSDACDLSSNDYLGFARPGPFQSFLQQFLRQHESVSSGATGSRLLSGHFSLTESLEKQAAAFHCSDAALLFNSGYDANLSLLSCLPGSDDAVVFDELIHASVHDGVRMGRARNRSFPFRHNDLVSLEEQVRAAAAHTLGSVIVCVETVYSMDGDVTRIDKVLDLCGELEKSLRRELHVIVDEAHAGGLFGENGEGLVVALRVHKHKNLMARVVTFGKAFAAHGAMILSSHTVREYLINYARPFIYSTALPPHTVLILHAVYEFASSYAARIARKQLWDVVKEYHYYTEQNLPAGALIQRGSRSPIQGICVPGNRNCVEVASSLRKAGFDVYPIRSPTVPRGEERIRVILHTHNTKEDVGRFVEAVAQSLKHLPRPSQL